MALRELLPSVAAAITSTKLPPDTGPAPSVCPRLVTTYCPALRPPPPEPWRPDKERLWAFTKAEPEPEAEAEPLGLSDAHNPKPPPRRYGENGITRKGRRSVERACAFLEDHRERVAFWTITLPTWVLRRMAELDCWPTFQARIRVFLRWALLEAGLPPHLVAVAELHPNRSMRERFPCPHLHVVYEGRRHRGEAWALGPDQLDGIIRRALASCDIHGADLSAAGKVVGVRKSVARYMAKYLSKGSTAASLCLGLKELLPRQWWFWTAELREQVGRLVLRLPWEFLEWVMERREELEDLGMLRTGRYDLPDPRAPSVWWISWAGVEGMAAAAGAWQSAVWDAEWMRTHFPI